MSEIYLFTIPLFKKFLTALDGLLVKAQAFVAEQNLAETTLLEAHIAPDMLPFKRQVQIACDNAKGAVGRLSGTEMPAFSDDEATFAELRERIRKTIDVIDHVDAEAFADAPTRQITLPYFPGKFLTGLDYAREHAVPNFFFHVVTAYDILRKEGVQIGKGDFLVDLPLKDLV